MVFLMGLLLGAPVHADEHDQGYGDYLYDEYVPPQNARYEVCYTSQRKVPAGEGGIVWRQEEPLHHVCWYHLDYATWVVAERAILEVQAVIVEAWAESAADRSDPQFQAIMQSLQRREP